MAQNTDAFCPRVASLKAAEGVAAYSLAGLLFCISPVRRCFGARTVVGSTAKVDECPRVALRHAQYVARLEVAVHDADGVQRLHTHHLHRFEYSVNPSDEGGCVDVLLELTDLAKPVETPCLCL